MMTDFFKFGTMCRQVCLKMEPHWDVQLGKARLTVEDVGGWDILFNPAQLNHINFGPMWEEAIVYP